MSKELKPIGDLSVTRFFGGKRGICVQLTKLDETGHMVYVQLSPYQMSKLICVFEKVIELNLPK